MAPSLLKSIYLFKEFNDEELKAVEAVCSTDSLSVGDEVFSEKDEASAFYIIKMGSVKISHKNSKGDEMDVATLGTGSHFGEMAFIDGERRSATATVVERTEILRADFRKLRDLLDGSPKLATKFYRSLSHFLCGRLRQTTTDLAFSREKNLRHF
ncbi:MAG: cyclic nucleotide-binding domain-containing protein [Bdellovibrionales bacterium]|nr:cyclic nucleotide-binding domain-containing protein [Bdellovibrionales bacterium]